MRILVAGAAGTIGRRVVAELAQDARVDELVVTARQKDRAERLASILAPGRAVGHDLDLTDERHFVQLARDVDVVVSAAGPHYRFELHAARAAIDAGTNYVSLCDDNSATARVIALDDAARDAGVTVISGCGMSPGVTNLLVAVAATELDDVEEIDIAVAASSADTPGAAMRLHFFAQMSEAAPSISDHSLEEVRAGTSPRLVYFPDPVGWVETFRSGHPEITTMPLVYPGLRSLRFRAGLTERAAMDVVRAAAAAGLLGTEKQRRLMLKLADPVRPALEALPPHGAPWTAARVDVRGHAAGRATTVSLAVVDHLTNLAAVPIACAAVMVGEGTSKKGVAAPEQVFDPGTFLTAIAQRGIRLARLDPVRV